MRRRGSFIWLSTTLALIGLLASSTVVAWAAYCSDDCSITPRAHDCCPADAAEDARQGHATLSALDCCSTPQALDCGTVTDYEPAATSTAHSQSDHASAALAAPTLTEAVLQPEHASTPPPLPAPSLLPTTRTTVLLL